MTPSDWDTLLVAFAAELTNAAYRVALQHGIAGSWVDLELDLWKALAERVQEWETTFTTGRMAAGLDTTAATIREESTYAERKNYPYRRPGRSS
jgi:hypothetical protein